MSINPTKITIKNAYFQAVLRIDFRVSENISFLTGSNLTSISIYQLPAKAGRLFVIIGRWTFSATGNFITDLSRLFNPVFVGEPSGAKPLMVGGDEAPFILPYSRAKGTLSSTTWALTNPRDTRLWIAPGIPVQLTAEDYFANRDTVMETLLTILRQQAKK